MNGFSSWIISITCVCVLSVLVDLMLPEGQTSNHIKTVFSYAIVLVILAPLPSLLNKKIDTNFSFYSEEINIQENYIYQINRNKLDNLKKQIQDDLIEKKLEGIDIAISGDIFDYSMKIEAVFVDFFNLVINENNEHIDIKTEVVESIQTYVNIEKEKIIFNE